MTRQSAPVLLAAVFFAACGRQPESPPNSSPPSPTRVSAVPSPTPEWDTEGHGTPLWTPALRPTPTPEPVYRTGGAVTQPVELSRVPFRLPSACQASTSSGVFLFEAVVDRDGTVRSVRALKRPIVSPPCPQLVDDLRWAILQRRYRPALLNKQPVRAYLIVSVFPSSISR